MRGATTLIRRYYWREMFFETAEIFAKRSGSDDVVLGSIQSPASKALWQECQAEAIENIKALHRRAPVYQFQGESPSDVIAALNVEVLELRADYTATKAGRAQLLWNGQPLTAEGFVCRHFEQLGYSALFVESAPFHVLFGAFMWSVIQDPSDPKVRQVGFGDRRDFDARVEQPRQIWTALPSDFGRAAFGVRREVAISERIGLLPADSPGLIEVFERELEASEPLRQYLWAHQDKHVDTAYRVLGTLPPTAVSRILAYLAASYWERFCGWPDLLVYRGDEFFFAEVKASGDKLREDQRDWIRGNAAHLHLPYRVVRIHRIR